MNTYLNGKVKVNGIVSEELGLVIDELNDIVEVNNKKIRLINDKIYIMLNKPVGYITTSNDQFSRPSVLDLIKEKNRVFSIGRLDMYTEGLLLLTNDGEFANKLMHPKNKIEKTYLVKVNDKVSDDNIKNLEAGVDIGGYITKPAKVKKITDNKFEIIISEGKNRQIRKMCESQNLKVSNLRRIKVGNIQLGNLKVGEYRFLGLDEIKNI